MDLDFYDPRTYTDWDIYVCESCENAVLKHLEDGIILPLINNECSHFFSRMHTSRFYYVENIHGWHYPAKLGYKIKLTNKSRKKLLFAIKSHILNKKQMKK